VTYEPDLQILEAQLIQLPGAMHKVIVDNGSEAAKIAALRQLISRIPNAMLHENGSNKGLPVALNIGAHCVHQQMNPPADYFLFLDQDTEPSPDALMALIEAYECLQAQGRKPGCVGPRLVDPSTELDHGFHQINGLFWSRIHARIESDPVSCSNLNCSGTLVKAELFHRLGGFDEDLFLDHLDTEWSFRVLAAGYGLFGIPGATFTHRMGLASFKFWLLRWRIWPYRVPLRHYYLFRNTISLMRRDYVPLVWKFWAINKLVVTLIVHMIVDRQRWKQCTYMVAGLRDGFQGIGGQWHG
jgi:rhamnosyltransferase